MYTMTPVLKTSRRLLLWNIVQYTFRIKLYMSLSNYFAYMLVWEDSDIAEIVTIFLLY